MKILIITLGVFGMGLGAMQLMALKSQKNIESYPYSVIESHEGFEIRMYESALFTSVTLNDSTYKEASGKGFSILAGYIFGDNERDQKISMTSPVAMSLEDSITMMFMVPKELKKDSLPRPSVRAIEFVEAPPRKVAAISFGGWANDRKIKKYRELLVRSLEKEGIEHTSRFSLLGYNPPFELVNRRNEIIVELP